MPSVNDNLIEEKRYETDVRSDYDCVGMPSKARFCIVKRDALEIIRLSSLVIENGLHKVEMFDNRTSWLDGEDSDTFVEANSELDTLNISSTEFWFSAYLKHNDVEILSQRQSIKELAQWFGIGIPKTIADATC